MGDFTGYTAMESLEAKEYIKILRSIGVNRKKFKQLELEDKEKNEEEIEKIKEEIKQVLPRLDELKSILNKTRQGTADILMQTYLPEIFQKAVVLQQACQQFAANQRQREEDWLKEQEQENDTDDDEDEEDEDDDTNNDSHTNDEDEESDDSDSSDKE